MSATIHLNHWRGTYLAQLELTDRGTFGRDWQEISNVVKGDPGTPTIRYYSDLHAGWYESREGYRMHKGVPTEKRYWRVDDTSRSEVDLETVVAAVTGPLPGHDGEWGTGRCHCGADVDTYTVDGFPRCADHPVVTVKVDESLGVPI